MELRTDFIIRGVLMIVLVGFRSFRIVIRLLLLYTYYYIVIIYILLYENDIKCCCSNDDNKIKMARFRIVSSEQ